MKLVDVTYVSTNDHYQNCPSLGVGCVDVKQDKAWK